MSGVEPPEESVPQPVIQHFVPSVGADTELGRQARFTNLTKGKENLAREREKKELIIRGLLPVIPYSKTF